ncbi:ABC transporter ATP-binding protein [Candidatus Haloredivivus sp. G17]|nr:ABC transporter ATP-binding protein [Candidatus Haloredivivus sp. G17]
MANDPEIVLADEPTGNLDTTTGGKIMDLLTEFNEEGKTIIMVTHDPNDAEYADRTIKIKDGVTHPGLKEERKAPSCTETSTPTKCLDGFTEDLQTQKSETS